MEGIVKKIYLSVFVRLVMWQMKRNRDTMGRLIHAGAAYSSPRLSQLDLKNQRLGMQLHTTLLRLLILRALTSEEKSQRTLTGFEHQKHLAALYGGNATRWINEPDIAREHSGV